MKIQIEYWNPNNKTVVTEKGFRYLDTKSVITRIEVWNGNKEEIFKKYDAKNNSLRYCNGSYYRFKDKELQEEYLSWYNNLSKSTKFNMYYGNGVVD